MTKCISCGTEIPADARFCGYCGTVQTNRLSEQLTQFSEPHLPAMIPREADPEGTLIGDKSALDPPISPMPFIPNPNEQLAMQPGQVIPGSHEEQRKAALLDAALPMTPASGHQPPVHPLPNIQGAPQVSNMPSIQGNPQMAVNTPPPHFTSNAAHNAPPHPSVGSTGHNALHSAPPHPSVGGTGHLSPSQIQAGHPGSVVPPHSSMFPGTQPVYPSQTLPAQPGYTPSGAEYYQHAPHQQPGYPTHTGQMAGHTGHIAGHTGRIAAQTGKTAATKIAGGLATKWVIVIITAVVVVTGGSVAAGAYILTRPNPTIHLVSNYHVGQTPAGSVGTTIHFTGDHFSGNSFISFFLDGQPAPGAPRPVSDKDGNVSADLSITSAWTVGKHTLTASDASNYSSKTGVVIQIVEQGEAHTLGPHGSPPDDTSFTVNFNTDQYTYIKTLVITGRPDPNGGSVCTAEDNGQPHRYNDGSDANGQSFSYDDVTSCIGTYKAGQITYTKTLVSEVAHLNDGATCTLQGSHVLEQVSGSYTDQGSFSGQITLSAIPPQDYSCTNSADTLQRGDGSNNISGTWTGTVTLS